MRIAAFAVLVACRPAPHIAPVVHPAPALGAPPASSPEPDPGAARQVAAQPRSPLDEVAAAAARSASDDHVVSSEAVRRAMSVHLGSGLWPHVVTGWGSDAQIDAQLAAALAELRRATDVVAIGTATADGRVGRVGVIVAMPAPTLPIEIERPGGGELAARVEHADVARIKIPWPWSTVPAAFDVTATATRRLHGRVDGGAFELAIDCARAAGTIEVSAGAHVIASITNACTDGSSTVGPGGSFDLGPPARSRIEVEQRLFELANRERRARGAAALVWDEAAHRFARQHSVDMARFGFVGHEASDGTPATARLRTFPALAVFENVARAGGPAEAHLGFMASPGHRANLLAREAERGAIGVEVAPDDPRTFYVTEVFIEPR